MNRTRRRRHRSSGIAGWRRSPILEDVDRIRELLGQLGGPPPEKLANGAAALVDLGGASLDPAAAVAAGVDLERLLWARPRRLKEALAAAEAIVQSGIPLVVVDLGLPPVQGRAAPSSWRRLARAAETSQVALLISSPYRITGTAAEVVIEAAQPRPRWQGDGLAPRVLGGLTSRLELRKSRDLWRVDDRLYGSNR